MNFRRNRTPPSQYELIERETAFVPMRVRNAREWTRELRAEREALSLRHFLRAQGHP